MPNGGSDCCGTCCFNSTIVAGHHPYGESPSRQPVRCVIRDADIAVPFWTYCANHPHHNPSRVELPIGPIYGDAGTGWPYRRKVLVPSPDTESIRMELLSLLCDIVETPRDVYPTSTQLDETVIWQLGQWREPRAAGELRRIVAFDPAASSPDGDRDRVPAIAGAIAALARIAGDEALPEIRRCLTLGREAARQLADYRFDLDRVAMIRYEAVKAVDNISGETAAELLMEARQDANPDVAGAARELLEKRK